MQVFKFWKMNMYYWNNLFERTLYAVGFFNYSEPLIESNRLSKMRDMSLRAYALRRSREAVRRHRHFLICLVDGYYSCHPSFRE